MRYLILFAIILGLISCHKSEKPIPPKPTSSEVEMGPLKISVPIVWTKQIDGEDQIAYADMDRHSLAFLSRDKCDLSYGACMILTMRGIASAGFIHVSADDVIVNDNRFILLVSHNDKLKVWSWLSLLNKQVFVVTCGGVEKDPEIEKDCLKIGSTIKVQK